MRLLSTNIKTHIAADTAIPRSLFYIELVNKDTGATNIVRLTNHSSNITFNGQVYTSYDVSHSRIKNFMTNQTDNCTLTLDNVDKSMSSYFAYNEFSGQKAEVYKVFLDSSLTVIDGYTAWTLTTAKILDDTVEPVTPNGFSYTCIVAGDTGASEPTWPTAIGDTVVDGTVTWECTGTDDDKIIEFTGFMNRPKLTEKQITVRIVNAFDRSQSFTPKRRFDYRCNWDFCGTKCNYNSGNGKARGLADSGTSTTLVDADLGAFADDYWKGSLLKVIAGTNKGAFNRISAYNGTTKTFTVDSAFTLAIDSTTKYIVECDKTKSTCEYLTNEAYFGGYDEAYDILAGKHGGVRRSKWVKTGAGRSSVNDKFVSIIYGDAQIKGVLLDVQQVHYSSSHWALLKAREDRLYAIAEGQLSSIENCTVGGVNVDTTNATIFSFHDGSASQSFSFPYNTSGALETKYLRRTAVAIVRGSFKNKWIERVSGYAGLWDVANGYSGDILQQGLLKPTYGEETFFHVKGLEVQKYLSDGTPDGVAAWSNNPVWCILDFILNRAAKPLGSALVNFEYFYNAAQQSDTFGYEISMNLSDQKKDTDILALMLTTCRGYFTYTSGKVEINIEQSWSHPELGDTTVAHGFDDSIGGGTEDNIVAKSFDYFEKDVNDVKNRIVVKYTDQEVRDNTALTGPVSVLESLYSLTYLPKVGGTIPYGDLQGTFSSTGTIYIAGEAITYTGNSGSQLTGCSARLNDYAAGYPLYQGAQTFPELTAIYNDWDEQDRRDRVNEGGVDGMYIPTYRRAYNIAEWFGKKSVDGLLRCNLKGMMDSLHISVGDVVNVTHDVPGWVDIPFRVVESGESEDEEVDYVLEFYDSSFYEDNDGLPAVKIGTTLANPFAAPEHVTNLSLTEDGYTNDDGAYIPTLALTYDPPSESTFWDHAVIQIRTDAESDYRDYGIDTSRGVDFTIDATQGKFSVGNTVYVRVISVNNKELAADYSTAPTTSNKIDGLVTAPDAPTGMRLEGGTSPVDYAWDGLRFAVVWRGASQTGGAGREGAGQELQGAGGVGIDPYWKYDEIEIWIGGELRHTARNKDLRYEYIYGDGLDQFLDTYMITANGAVTIKVRRWNVYNMVSDSIEITLAQQSPANPSGLTTTALYRSMRFWWTKSTDTDYKEYQVRTKVTSGGTWTDWQSIQANTHDRSLTDIEVDDNGITASIYIEVKTVDIYGNESTVSSTNAACVGVRADDIVAGSIKSASFQTNGSYCTEAITAAQTTLDLRDGTDFASSGSGWALGTTNDRDAFSWTGKTGNQLTGCTGLLDNPTSSLVIPDEKNILLALDLNELRFYGDRGDATVEELATIGIKPYGSDDIIAYFGSSLNSNYGVFGYSSKIAIMGRTDAVAGVAVYGLAVNVDGGIGVHGKQWYGSSTYPAVYADGGGLGLRAEGTVDIQANQSGLIEIKNYLTSDPSSSGTHGRFYVKSGALYYRGTSGTVTKLANA